jgi:hypothetical protein
LIESSIHFYSSETFVIRDKEALRTQEHTVAFTDISHTHRLKSMTSINSPSTKYLVIYIIRIGTMYVNENIKDISEGNTNTLKKTKNETNDIRRPYVVACKIIVFSISHIFIDYFQVINMSQQLDCHSRMKASSSEKEIIVPFGFNM